MKNSLRILAMSDIHGEFGRFAPERLPEADVVIIAGDITNLGRKQMHEMLGAAEWFFNLDEKYATILWIPGNHDIGIDERTFRAEHLQWIKDKTVMLSVAPASPARFLVHGVSLAPCYGEPALARAWVHMTTDPAEEAAAFDFEPVNIIVSHSPPLGCLDGENGDHFGSDRLREKIVRDGPQLVICGHIHESAGGASLGTTAVLNVARSWALLDIWERGMPHVIDTEMGWGQIANHLAPKFELPHPCKQKPNGE